MTECRNGLRNRNRYQKSNQTMSNPSDTRIKVLYFLNSLVRGGVEEHVLRLIDKLDKEKFEPVIKALKEKMETGDAKEQYLGSGSNGDAYRIEIDGKEYAAKFSRSLTQANFEIKPLLRAEGIEHAAQLTAYSFEHKAVTMELLPGTDVTNFSPENAPEYSDEDIVQLIETVQKLDRKF